MLECRNNPPSPIAPKPSKAKIPAINIPIFIERAAGAGASRRLK
jgi:hypothetical protein